MVLRRLFLIILCTFTHCASIEEHQAAFVQTGDELHYFVNAQQLEETHQGFSQHSHTFIKSANAVDATTGDTQVLNQLKFEPVLLHFGDHAIGIPHLQKVTVRNPTASKVRFDAISGSTVHFHCSFFEHKTVEPGGDTTFDVVFLPRQEGVIENTLFIHSSLGTFTYTVTGVGVANPYRLRPFVGARIPLNGTFISAVELHNPHPATLRVTEMYTSGGDLHLELPHMPGKKEGSTYTWEIPPFQTKTVMQAKFVAAKEKNTTAYIRIKTNLNLAGRPAEEGYPSEGTLSISSHNASEESVQNLMMDFPDPPPTIILPFEVEVVAKAGLFTNVDMLDFGIIRNDESSRTLELEVVSTAHRSIDITTITLEPENDAVEIQFQPTTVKSSANNPRKTVSIAKITFHGSKLLEMAESKRRTKGHVVVKSKGGNYKLSVPYAASVFHGRLLHDTQETSFYAGHTPPLLQNVTVKNTFNFPIVVYNVSVPRTIRGVLAVKTFAEPVTIPANGEAVAFSLRYTGGMLEPLTSFCRLYTNLSKFDLPVHIFSGKIRITLYSIDQSQFDFGMLDVGDKRSILFAVTNENVVPIPLNEFKGVMDSFTSLSLLGVEEGNETVLAKKHNVSEYEWRPGEDFSIPAKSFAVFEYTVTAPQDRAVFHSSMTFQTPYELLYYPVTFYIEEGAIVSIPEKITFPEAFPGKISSQPLQVYSTFLKDMPLLRLSTLSHDPRIFFESFDKNQPTPVIKHGEMSYLGRVFFFPIAGCMDDCYVGMPLNTNDGAWFIYGMRLPPNLPDIDAYLYSKLRRKWNAIEKAGEDIVNSTIIVDSTEVKHLEIPAKGQLVWPRLLKQSVVHFPLTAVGNFTIVNLTLHNPSSLPVVVQLLPLTIYPDPETLVELFKNELPSPMTDNIEMNETLMFTLRDTELFNLRRDSPVPKFRQQLEESLGGIRIPRFTLSLMLQPGMKVRVRVGFLPKDYELRSSLLLIRNNLTVLEPVCLYGRGARVELKVGNRLPRTLHSLLFDIQDHHLADCHNPKRLTHKLMTTLTVRRSFMTRNTGEVPVTVMNISVNGFPCQNRGFRVLNCDPFRLKPNETHLLEIAFTPDFTLSWYDASLQLYLQGNGTPFSYPLAASVPKEWLEKCQNALPRPQWEPLMYYSCVTALIFLLICMIASAYLEGDRIITCALRQQVKMRKVFDLNAEATYNGGAALTSSATPNGSTSLSARVAEAQDEISVLNFFVKIGAWVFDMMFGTGKPKPDSDLGVGSNSGNGRSENGRIAVGAGHSPGGNLRQRKQQQGKGAAGQVAGVHQGVARKNSGSNFEEKGGKKGGNKQQQKYGGGGGKQQQTEEFEINEQTQRKSEEEWVMVDRPKRHGTPNLPGEVSESGAVSKSITDQHTTTQQQQQKIKERHATKKTSYDSDRERKKRSGPSGNRSEGSEASKDDSWSPGRVHGMDQQPVSGSDTKAALEVQPKARSRSAAIEKMSLDLGSTHHQDRQRKKSSEQSVQAENLATTPYTFVKEVTSAVMSSKNNSVCGGSASESEESNIPDWDMPSDSVNYEDAFGEMAAQAQGFADEVIIRDDSDHFLPSDPATTTKKPLKRNKRQQSAVNIQRPSSTESAASARGNNLRTLEPLEPVSSSSRSTSSSSLGRSGQEASDSSSPSPQENVVSVPRKRRSAAAVMPPPTAYADNITSSGSHRERRLPPKSPTKSRRHATSSSTSSAFPPISFGPPGIGSASVEGSMLSPMAGTPVTPDEPNYGWGHKTERDDEPQRGQKLTIMQQLQLERKKRLQEYRLQQRQKGEEWPGMNLLSPVSESLWDDDYEPWNLGAEDAWGATGILSGTKPPPGPIGAPARAPSVESTKSKPPKEASKPKSKERSKPASKSGKANGSSASATNSMFRLDPTVPPFVSAREKAEMKKKRSSTKSPVAELSASATKKVSTPPPDPGILSWDQPSIGLGIGVSVAMGSDELAERAGGLGILAESPPSPSNPLGLSGSLFSGVGSIWDPSHPVNPEVSWTGPLSTWTSTSLDAMVKDLTEEPDEPPPKIKSGKKQKARRE